MRLIVAGLRDGMSDPRVVSMVSAVYLHNNNNNNNNKQTRMTIKK